MEWGFLKIIYSNNELDLVKFYTLPHIPFISSGDRCTAPHHPKTKTMNKLYIITATSTDGTTEELYSSYDRSDCVYEKDAEKTQWKEQGYKAVKIGSRQTEEAPDPEVYDAATTGELKPQIEKVMKTTTDKLEGDTSPEVHSITKDDEGQILVNFEDEDVMHIIAGNIPCSAYDELETNLAALGYAVIDSDGATWILEAIDTPTL
jgi:hypothetical protein